MAIINCPECGEKISDTVKNCVHCGCEITRCPECESLFLGRVEVCPNCGFCISKPDLKVAQTSGKRVNDIAEATKLWYKEKNPFDNLLSRPIAFMLFGLAAIVLFVIAIVGVIIWANGSANGIVEGYATKLENTKTLCIFASLSLMAAYLLYEYLGYPTSAIFSSWLIRNKLNAKELVSAAFKKDMAKLTTDDITEYANSMNLGCDAAVFSTSIISKTKKRNEMLISLIMAAAYIVFLCSFLITNAEAYMGQILWYGEFSFSDIKLWWALIAAVVMFIARKIYVKNVDAKEDAARDAWFKDNYPEHYRLYDQYVKNFANYFGEEK